MSKNQIPLAKFALSPLMEDLAELRLIDPIAEADEADDKEDEKGDEEDAEKGEGYNYGDKLKGGKGAKTEECDDEDESEDDSDDDYSEEQIEAAQQTLEQFDALSAKDRAKLTEQDHKLVKLAEGILTEKRRRKMGSAQYNAMMKSRKQQTTAEKQKNRSKRRAKRQDPAGVARAARREAQKTGGRTGQNSDTGNVDEIIERLNGLTKPLLQDSRETGALSDKIVEGFKGVHFTADEIADRISSKLSEDTSKDDPRYKLAEFFDGLAEDAKVILDRIFGKQDVKLEDAVADLQAITGDLRKGLTALKSL